MDLKPGDDAMQLTFGCPTCGKAYDLPWSLAGKKARCKRCSVEFVIPAPLEPKGPKSSEAIPVFDPTDHPQSHAPSAEDHLPVRFPVTPKTVRVARTRKLEAPGSLDRKAEPEPPPTINPAERAPNPTTRTADRPMPRPDDPLFPPSARTSRELDRPRSRPRPRRDDDDFEPDSIDPVTGSRKRPAWLIPTFVVADLAIVLIVVGQLSMFVGGDDDDDDEPVRTAPVSPPMPNNLEPDQLPAPVDSPAAADPPSEAPIGPSGKSDAAEPADPNSSP